MQDGVEAYHPFIKSVIHRYYPVPKDALSRLISIAGVRKAQKGEVLLHVGTPARYIYILFRGAVVAYYLNREGSTYDKNIFLEGDFVGSTVSNLTNKPSKFSLEALEESTLISFNYQQYRQLINTDDDLKNFYIAYLEKNWVIDKEKREVDIVMKDATKRYLELLEDHPLLDTRIPLVHIASHLGVTPTQLSRIRKNLKK
jgi:CRP-like cAMP-binding protein